MAMTDTATELPEAALRLLEGATECFAQQGYQATTTRDISSKAGFSPGALYFHFESKETVLFHVIVSAHQGLLETLAQIPASAPGAELATVSAQISTATHWFVDNHDLAHVAQHEVSNLTPEHAQEVRGLSNAVEATFQAPITAGCASGAFSVPDEQLFVRAILSLTVDVIRWYRPGSRYSAEQLADSNVGILTAYLTQDHAR